MITETELTAALAGMTLVIDASTASYAGDMAITGNLTDPAKTAQGLTGLITAVQRNTAPAAVVVATPTVQSGLVLRWYKNLNDAGEGRNFAVLSASRSGVLADGQTHLHDIPAAWLSDAERAHQLLARNLEGAARALATHQHTRVYGGPLCEVTR